MTFTVDLAIWLVCCMAGLLTACGSLRYAWLLLDAAERREVGFDVIDGMKHLWRTELERALGWTMFFVTGVVAVVSPPFDQQGGRAPITALITWMLVGTIALWSFKTGSDFLYARRRWRVLHDGDAATDHHGAA